MPFEFANLALDDHIDFMTGCVHYDSLASNTAADIERITPLAMRGARATASQLRRCCGVMRRYVISHAVAG
jgi:hypothetical protein